MRKLSEVMAEIREEVCKNNSDKLFYVYLMYKPNGTIFYVGKGTARDYSDQRISYHELEARSAGKWKKQPHLNHLKLNTIRKIWEEGKEILYAVDSWHKTEEACYNREKELIQILGRKITKDGFLTNLTEGGEKEMTTASDETRELISSNLKKYYSNIDLCKEMSERNKKYFEDHPEARERARENSIKNNNAEYIRKWLKETDTEVLEAKFENHSKFMKEWHATEEGKAVTKLVAAKRNAKVQTEEHRQHMANKTAEFIKNNPEAYAANREKVRLTHEKTKIAKQACLHLLQDKLFLEGKIKNKQESDISTTVFGRWKNNGWLPDFIPNYGGLKQWEECLEKLIK